MALVLVVDDDSDIRTTLRVILETEGHRTIEAQDGTDLLGLTLTHWPDLILLDHLMPKVTGLEALENLRTNPSTRDFPVIMITAVSRPREALRARELGVTEYIGKPWSKGEIEMRVKWVLSRSKRPTRNPQERIVAVDDEEHVRMALVSLLEDAGYEAAPVASGEEALEVAASQRPHLLLLDLRMPVVDGFEVLRRLREDAATARLPVIVVSAAQSHAEVAEAVRLGAVDYVVKPWHPRDLERRVRKALDAAAITAR